MILHNVFSFYYFKQATLLKFVRMIKIISGKVTTTYDRFISTKTTSDFQIFSKALLPCKKSKYYPCYVLHLHLICKDFFTEVK